MVFNNSITALYFAIENKSIHDIFHEHHTFKRLSSLHNAVTMLKNQPEDWLSKESRGILYHCRMRYLKSRDGNDRINKAPLISSSRSQIPCPAARLLPPVELMTREYSLRHSYWKTHKLPTLPKADFLKRKEDPEVKKKRDLIYARIRATDIPSERYNRDMEARRRLEAEGKGSSEAEISSTDDDLGSRETSHLEVHDSDSIARVRTLKLRESI